MSAKDEQGRLLCGAAVGITANVLDRVDALVKANVDVIVIDSAHGHSANIFKTLRLIKEHYPDLQVIAGNVATAEATRDLIAAGADAVKSRYRTWFYLYDPCRCRYRCTADHSRYGLLCGSKEDRNSDHRRRRYQVLRRHDKGYRSRCQCLHDGKHLRRMR